MFGITPCIAQPPHLNHSPGVSISIRFYLSAMQSDVPCERVDVGTSLIFLQITSRQPSHAAGIYLGHKSGTEGRYRAPTSSTSCHHGPETKGTALPSALRDHFTQVDAKGSSACLVFFSCLFALCPILSGSSPRLARVDQNVSILLTQFTMPSRIVITPAEPISICSHSPSSSPARLCPDTRLLDPFS